MGLDSLQDGLNIITEHPITSTAIATGAVGVGVGTALGISALAKARNKKTKRTHTKRGWKLDRKKFNRSQKWEVAYRKRKRKIKKKHRRGSKRVYYAKKTGQPYIILSSGKAKFIKGKRRYK